MKAGFFGMSRLAFLFLAAVLCYASPTFADSQKVKGNNSGLMGSEESGQQKTVTLDELIQEVGKSNPGIKAAQETASAKKIADPAGRNAPRSQHHLLAHGRSVPVAAAGR